MSDKKGKISLSGLGKGSSSSSLNQFPSFRFSPENEEIHEIMMDESITDEQPDSLPDSPKPGAGGDVSPLKEYILKHKWTNWEKRSLSLDLDLKGKIITAIEDKRKSIVSHFIPEETGGVIPSSQSVTEHIGIATGGEDTLSITHSISSNSSNGGTANWGMGTNSSKSGTQGGNSSKQSQSNQNSEITELSPADEFEEIGVDYVATMGENGSEDDTFYGDLPFVVPCEDLFEHLGGQPQLYQPASLNLQPTLKSDSSSIDESLSVHTEYSVDETYHDASPSPSESPIYAAESTPETAKEVAESMCTVLYTNPLTAVLVLMFAIGICVQLWVPIFGTVLSAVYFFILGIFSTIHVTYILSSGSDVDDPKDRGIFKTPTQVENPYSPHQTIISPPKEIPIKLPTRSQGWMTELETDYDPITCHLRMTRIVFVKLDGSSLFISYPHPKFRVPKRKVFSDPPLPPEIIFVRHEIFSIAGADISIAPDKLARKRAWNKKYPIRIVLPDKSIRCKVTPANTMEDIASSPESSNQNGHNSHSPTKEILNQHHRKKVRKEILKEDCSFKVIHLFSRTDREKDDWFRRFKAASHTSDEDEHNPELQDEHKLLHTYRDYMARILPLLDFSDKSKQTEKFDNVSVVAFGSASDKITISKGPNQLSEGKSSNKEKDSPSSSKKSTPEKEKHKDDFSDFGLESISSIPQSPAFLNAFLGRMFFDFLGSNYWKEQVRILIQKKLFYIKKPPFLGELKVTDLDLGCSIPIIHRASAPVMDHHGLWMDLDLTYDGRMVVTLETHINLFKLRKTTSSDDAPGTSASPHIPGASGQNRLVDHPEANLDPNMAYVFNTNSSNIYDSEADDSGESSESDLDAEDLINAEENKPPPEATQKGKQKIIRFAERLASSKYMKTKVVKRVVGNLGNTPLILTIELMSLVGTLAVNIPPPPNDRVWVGFRGNPNIELCTKPKFGDRAVTFVHVSKWIKKKLVVEFQRVMVLPNMNDISVPLMEFKLPK